jgi:uncharacterized membrane protein
VSKGRLESFSDGVIAVAITLLALNLPIPSQGTPRLAEYLGNHWPNFVAFVISFLTIGVVWVNHHATLRRVAAVDTMVLLLNLVLLMTICALPFSTALMADYLRADSGENLAAAIWCGSFLLMASAFLALQRHLLLSKPHLLHKDLTPQVRRLILRRNSVGLLPYAAGVAAAALTPYLSLAICGAVAVYYALPGTTEVGDVESPSS